MSEKDHAILRVKIHPNGQIAPYWHNLDVMEERLGEDYNGPGDMLEQMIGSVIHAMARSESDQRYEPGSSKHSVKVRQSICAIGHYSTRRAIDFFNAGQDQNRPSLELVDAEET